jgi:hypothetical protein
MCFGFYTTEMNKMRRKFGESAEGCWKVTVYVNIMPVHETTFHMKVWHRCQIFNPSVKIQTTQ